MISTTNRKRDSRPRGAMRWIAPTLAMLALAGVCGVLGAYVFAPILSTPAAAPASETLAAATPAASDRPVVSYPSGANQVTIVEKPIAPPPSYFGVTEPEPDLSISVEPSEEMPDATHSGRDQRERRGEPDSDSPRGPPRNPAGPAGGREPAARRAPSAESGSDATPSGSGAAAAAGSGSPVPGGAERGTRHPEPGTPAEAEAGPLYRVQVGRFADESDARALAEELKRDGLAPSVVRSGPEGKGLYRVQVGTFRQRENADKALEALRRKQLEPYLAEEEP